MAYAAPVGNIADSAVLKSAFITQGKARPSIGITAGEETDFIFDRQVEDYGYQDDSKYDSIRPENKL
jgi:hypothetical protein